MKKIVISLVVAVFCLEISQSQAMDETLPSNLALVKDTNLKKEVEQLQNREKNENLGLRKEPISLLNEKTILGVGLSVWGASGLALLTYYSDREAVMLFSGVYAYLIIFSAAGAHQVSVGISGWWGSL